MELRDEDWNSEAEVFNMGPSTSLPKIQLPVV